jgi:hypothetical protein
MNKMGADSKQYDLCGQVIGAAMKVHSTPFIGAAAPSPRPSTPARGRADSIDGPGFLESVYRNALILSIEEQVSF